jgi:hypothetical protein
MMATADWELQIANLHFAFVNLQSQGAIAQVYRALQDQNFVPGGADYSDCGD